MASERNRILDLIDYVRTCGIVVNFGKNKARGNRGFFKVVGKDFRIDIAKGLPENYILGTISHEFAHYVHYTYDKNLKDLGFVFSLMDDDIVEELLKITVELLPKSSVEPFFKKKEVLEKDINLLMSKLYDSFPDFKKSNGVKLIENRIKNTDMKYLLKYDMVNVQSITGAVKKYSIGSLSMDSEIEIYLHLKSKQRALKRLNSRIARLNKYYNLPTELFARAFEMYILNKDKLAQIAPGVYKDINDAIILGKLPLLCNFVKIISK